MNFSFHLLGLGCPLLPAIPHVSLWSFWTFSRAHHLAHGLGGSVTAGRMDPWVPCCCFRQKRLMGRAAQACKPSSIHTGGAVWLSHPLILSSLSPFHGASWLTMSEVTELSDLVCFPNAFLEPNPTWTLACRMWTYSASIHIWFDLLHLEFYT